MEQHHQQNVGAEEMSMSMNGGKMSNNNNNTNNNSNNYNMCRQSSTRWTPTTEQIKLLKELYYIKGVRSPSADEIQHICTRLRRYGKIEGKNVFYWFQNHKARERQKKRFNHSTSSSSTRLPNNNNNINNNNPIITPNNINNNNPIIANNTTNNNGFIINNNNGGLGWKQDHHQDITLHAKYPSCTLNNPGVSCSSSSGGLISGGGQLMGSFGYGAVTMENKFRDCSISSGGGGYMLNGGNQWSGVGTNYNPYAPPPNYSNFLDKISSIDEDSYIEQDYYYGASQAPHIETLPLFPMHNDDDHHDHDHDDDGYGHDHHHHHDYNHHGFFPVKPQPDGYYTGGYRWPNGMGGSASLELSLNSYGYGCYSQNL